jgi:xylan 1,4-beta-xylosidase
MNVRIFTLFSCLLISLVLPAQTHDVRLTVNFNDNLGPMQIDRFSLGQGGLSSDSMFADRTAELRALRPRVIRLFVQDYFDLLPESGRYHFDTLDASVDSILKTGATPLLCIVFKPKALFPRIDQDLVEPTSWKEWDALIYALVSHYERRNGGGWYWEVGNEWDLQSGGGTPYHMKPEQYTRFFEHTIAAIRRADPKSRVGGPGQALLPAPLISALLDFCEENSLPLDFVSWHGYENDPQWYRQSVDSIRNLLRQHPKLRPETVIDEWNMNPLQEDADPRLQPVFIAESTFQMISAGLDLSCYFHIRDYPFDDQAFGRVHSAHDVAEQKRFWDRHSIHFGLFDYQNQVRPSYFVFKLLARLTGDRVASTSESATAHSLATHDEILRISSVLVWNYSSEEANVSLNLNDLPTDTTASRYMLDAIGPNSDDSSRLRPQPTQKLSKGNGSLSFRLEPWGIAFISLE